MEMSQEMVMKFSSGSRDVELVTRNLNGQIIGKLIDVADAAKELIKVCQVDYDNFTIDNLDGNILYMSRNNNLETYIIKLPERRIKCTYDKKAYSLIHPNTIFKLTVESASKIYRKMEAYCYKEYKGKNTELFRYPFPNMLGVNSICTGTISNDASDPMEAIMNVIEGNYTHSTTSNHKIKKTIDFFKAMKKEFQYDILEKLGMSLEAIIKNN